MARWHSAIALLFCFAHTVHCESITKAPGPTSSNSTCPFRTINYLTHGLPQQCLTSSRNATTASVSEPNVTPVGTTSAAPDAIEIESQAISIEPHEASATGVSHAAEFTEGQTPESFAPVSTSSSSSSHTHQTNLPELVDEDSPLESGNFLSFEEWKKQSLKKAGQSEHLGNDGKPELYEGRKRISNIHNSLDSLGDDGEIELDFSGLVPGGPGPSRRLKEVTDSAEDEHPDFDADSPPKVRLRSKDAGTTCKERFNYASFDCAANVLKTNPAAKSALSVLGENKDSYMLNECSAGNKFIILELCNDISIDTLVLANFEFFSSTFRTFRVSVSDRYPVKIDKWRTIGTYEARNTREVQAFLVENPVIWARYLRIEFLTHYGNEFYCPVSLVRVHGTTMLEEYKHDLEATGNEENEDAANTASDSDSGEDSLVPEAVAEELLTPLASEAIKLEDQKPTVLSVESQAPDVDVPVNRSGTSLFPQHMSILQSMMSDAFSTATCFVTDAPTSPAVSSSTEAIETLASLHSPSTTTPTTPMALSPISTTTESTITGSSSTAVESSVKLQPGSEASSSDHESITKGQVASTMAADVVSNATDTQNATSHVVDRNRNATASDRSKSTAATTTTTQPQPALPTMQESFFKSVQKRLQMLESNSSLSLQYIEDQYRALRDAIKKIEQRQLSRTTTFLDSLNATVLSELREFRQQYDQLWQSTVIELEFQRERYERDNEAIHARLGILADEVIFQRRIGILQMILILVCLILVLFSRGAIHNYLELPLVQNVLSRSPKSRWLNLSGADTPSRPPGMARTKSAHELRTESGHIKGHRRLPSDDSTNDTLSVPEVYSPPTPLSLDVQLDDEVSQS